MYVPSHFQIHSLSELHSIIQQQPLGVLVTQHDGLDANHIPFLLDVHASKLGTLMAHVARANPLCMAPSGCEVLVVFRGVHGYITPNSYPSKQQTHRQVPTWNYEVVHAHGQLIVRDDAKFVRSVVGKLTKQHEAQEQSPWKMSDAPADYLEAMIHAVVGLEITITHIEGKAKLSQNKDRIDQQGVIQDLRQKGHEALARKIETTNQGT